MKTINEIMKTSPRSITKNETLKDAAKQMNTSNIGFLPVIDEDQKVVGAITDRDITLAISKNSKTADDIKVHEVMNSKVHTVQPEDDAASALNIMRTKQVGRLPVVDKENRLKGVISLMGISRNARNTTELSQLEHTGIENIIETIYSLAQRNSNHKTLD